MDHEKALGILQSLSQRLGEQLRRLEADIYNAAGH